MFVISQEGFSKVVKRFVKVGEDTYQDQLFM